MKFTMYTHFSETVKALGLEKATDLALSLGVDSVEFFDMATDGWTATFASAEEARIAGEYLRSKGLTVACYSVGATLYDFETGKTNAGAIDLLKFYADVAHALGSPYLHHTLIVELALKKPAPTLTKVLPCVLDGAQEVARYCKTRSLTCLYEGQGLYFNGVAGFGEFFNRIKKVCDNVGVCGDVGNTLFVGENADRFFETYKYDIRHVHIKDYLVREQIPENDLLGWTKTGDGKFVKATAIGEGDIDLAPMLDSLKSVGYDGAFAFESIPRHLLEKTMGEGIKLVASLYA